MINPIKIIFGMFAMVGIPKVRVVEKVLELINSDEANQVLFKALRNMKVDIDVGDLIREIETVEVEEEIKKEQMILEQTQKAKVEARIKKRKEALVKADIESKLEER